MLDCLFCVNSRDYQSAVEEQKRRQQMAVEDAERSHAKHSKFLNQTMEKSVFAVIQSYKIYHDMLHFKALLIFVLHFGLIINTIVPAYYSWIIFFTDCKNDMKMKIRDTKST